MNPLRQLSDYGQSLWIDNLSRDMLRNGELERRWRQDGLRGVTSNPAIFHKAIAAGSAYDEQIHRLFAEGKSVHEVYEEVVTSDVRDACDVLRPLYDRSEGLHGFVSLEVSPHLAYDAEASIREAHHLRAKVGRPNLYIKIPGTEAGIHAIEALLFDGVSVNITLLFAIDVYEAVAEAYLRALERRLAEGRSLTEVSSVASFFLSRIDNLVDRALHAKIQTENGVGAEPRPQDLLGRTAIANAKLAYQRFLHITGSDRWRRLAERGARPQQLVWASTSTKNPKYSDVMYVEPLIGRDTVNTLPDVTLAAYADHGKARADTVEEGIDEAAEVLSGLERLGIDLKGVTDQLQREGVQKFIEPYDALLDLIAAKRG
jgi:transaldolase